MDELKRLRSSRRGYRTHLRQTIGKVTENLQREGDSPADIASLTDLREQLQRKKDILVKLDESVAEHIVDEDELEAEICESEDIQASISENITHINRFLESRSNTATATVTANNTQQPGVQVTATETVVQAHVVEPPHVQLDDQPNLLLPASHSPTIGFDHPINDSDPIHTIHSRAGQGSTRLPKLSIPTFSGDTLEWQSFWDCFEAAVHSNPCLTGVQKLNYLRAQLLGEASKVVAGFPLTNANYEHSVTLLRER